MPLTATNFVNKGPVLHADMLQFYNLFTGVMVDQPVTFKNTVTIGGNQGTTTVPVKLYGAVGQTGHLLDLYPDNTNANPGWGIAASGQMAWGPGGAAPIDTNLSRVATQNGHSTDTAGLLISPYLEVAGGIGFNGALTFLSSGASISQGTAGSLALTINQDLTVNRDITAGRNLILPGAAAVISFVSSGSTFNEGIAGSQLLATNGSFQVTKNLSVGAAQPSVDTAVQITTALTSSATSQYGIYMLPTFTSTVQGAYAILAQASLASGTYTVPEYDAVRAAPAAKAASVALTNSYGVNVINQGQAGVTNAYGIYIGTQSGATNNYGLYIGGGVYNGIINNAYSILASNTMVGSASVPRTDAILTIGGSWPTSNGNMAGIWLNHNPIAQGNGDYIFGIRVGMAPNTNGRTGTTAVGVWIDAISASGATIAYGLYVAQPSGATNNFALTVNGRLQLAETFTTSASVGGASPLPGAPAMYFNVTDYTGATRKVPAWNV